MFQILNQVRAVTEKIYYGVTGWKRKMGGADIIQFWESGPTYFNLGEVDILFKNWRLDMIWGVVYLKKKIHFLVCGGR